MRRILPIAWIVALSSLAFATDYSGLASCKVYLAMEGATGNETGAPGGTFTASASAPTQTTTHKLGTYAKDFSGTSQYFSQADGGATDISGADQPITIAMWIRPDAWDCWLCDKWTGPAVDYHKQYEFGISDTGILIAGLCYGVAANATYARSTTHVLKDGTWTHVAFVYNDIDMRIYVNGVLDSNGTDNPKAYTAGMEAATDTFYISAGNWYGVSGFYNGIIDEFGMWNAALSSTQVSDICTNGIVGPTRVSNAFYRRRN
jgi:hypothetical protein